MAWYDELSGGKKYISTKIGADITMEIIAINKVTDKPEFQPQAKNGTRQGFVFEFVGPEGVITASTYALQNALKTAEVEVGDTIRIQHPEPNKYIVTKIK